MRFVLAAPVLLLGFVPTASAQSPKQFHRVAAGLRSNDPALAVLDRVGNPNDKLVQAATVTFFGFALSTSITLNSISMYAPMAIRACRVAFRGSPVQGRRDTLLWIASPIAYRIKAHYVYGQPLEVPRVLQRRR